MTLVNKNWLLWQFPIQKIKEMFTFLKVQRIKVSRHESAQYAEVSLFLPREDNERQKVYAFIKCELHLVERLKTNILIGNNILTPESFVLYIGLNYAVMGSYNIKIIIRTR